MRLVCWVDVFCQLGIKPHSFEYFCYANYLRFHLVITDIMWQVCTLLLYQGERGKTCFSKNLSIFSVKSRLDTTPTVDYRMTEFDIV